MSLANDELSTDHLVQQSLTTCQSSHFDEPSKKVCIPSIYLYWRGDSEVHVSSYVTNSVETPSRECLAFYWNILHVCSDVRKAYCRKHRLIQKT